MNYVIKLFTANLHFFHFNTFLFHIHLSSQISTKHTQANIQLIKIYSSNQSDYLDFNHSYFCSLLFSQLLSIDIKIPRLFFIDNYNFPRHGLSIYRLWMPRYLNHGSVPGSYLLFLWYLWNINIITNSEWTYCFFILKFKVSSGGLHTIHRCISPDFPFFKVSYK